ncbi:bifunctional UDP-N-acetylglucosamine diphosphorylase/glucosamine-1-phosphate N-acetyltransferase GlmU [Caviibacter abscessus]|uniref:bifunctional UDP-N-acetylglucosamine diphosphorylase/glucosamine-1-phosphate N-acetyltransferase GlmU n=1 Tax=Caviibacter abscessus TaxID=1766719 RepID=UPI00082CDF41|nr:bifunctional UDP-N-acetylglucosamine diphosphorylase/glucosamine-1-phosphate N-acetyltransferase GlmU [Caviibacter abscessus]
MLSLILAAGKGTRMKSNIPKVMHKVNGKPMLKKVTQVCEPFGKILLVLGDKKDLILESFSNFEYVFQEEQLGTAHAVMIAKEYIEKINEPVLITYGDGPLLSSKTISKMKEKFEHDKLDCLVLSCILDNPTGYGRIIKQENKVIDIVEEKEANNEQKKINEINIGVYIFNNNALLNIIDKIDNNNLKNEYYLTDAIKLLHNNGYKVDSMLLDDVNEMLGVNSKQDLAIASNILRHRKLNSLMEDGVIIIDPNTTYIEDDVIIGKDSVIYPNTIITGNTNIGENCIIYSSRIEESIIKDNVKIDNSVVEYATIEDKVTIGPFAHLRKGANLKESVHVGNFVEIKNSTLNDGVKAGHLTYIGDSEIGKNTNIGAGTITCNYDGINKHKTNIGENSFIGSNTILVAPVNVGNNVLTAAGSVITKDVDDNKLAFGRARQVTIDKIK